MLPVWLPQEGLRPLRGIRARPEIPSGALRGIRARPERDPERASEPGRFGPLRVTSALRGVCAPPGRGLKPVGGRSPGKTSSVFVGFQE